MWGLRFSLRSLSSGKWYHVIWQTGADWGTCCLEIHGIKDLLWIQVLPKFAASLTNYNVCDPSRQHSLMWKVSVKFPFMLPCIVTNFFTIRPTRCTNFVNLFCHETLHVSDSASFHHQKFIRCTLSNSICHTGVYTDFEQEQDGTTVTSWSCSKAVWHIPLLSVQWINSWWWAAAYFISKITVSRAVKDAGTEYQSQSDVTSLTAPVAKALTVAQRVHKAVRSGY